MSITIRPERGGQWRQVTDPIHDPRVTDIENWPHAFDEHPDRWWTRDNGTTIEVSTYAGCRICGASELSQIHLQAVT